MNDKIFELLQQKAELSARIKLLPYSGTPEIKEINEKKYLYMRKRVAGKLLSKYVGEYSDELYRILLHDSSEEKELNKKLNKTLRELIRLGYSDNDISEKVFINIDFARANMKANIYDQAILEGVATSFPQTDAIIENGIVNGMSSGDVQKILNLKHAWEFILDKDVIQCPSDYNLLCAVAKNVNEGFFYDGGRIRSVPVTIGGSRYIPPIPDEKDVIDTIKNIKAQNADPLDTAVSLCLYCMKTQIFIDGNKRAAVIFANHFLISKGCGLIIIPAEKVPQFKKLLVDYYEGQNEEMIKNFLKKNCHKKPNG